MTSVLVIVVVLALVGVAAFGILGGFSGSKSKTTCQPVASPACGAFVNTHDVSLLVPFRSVQQGVTVPFTATLPSGETATRFAFNFGDGASNRTAAPTTSHVYRAPGTYLASVMAEVSGLPHDNYGALVQVQVSPSFAADSSGDVPGIRGAITSNGSAAAPGAPTGAPTGALYGSGTLTVNASYTSAPTNPAWRVVEPSVSVVPSLGTTISSVASSFVGTTATVAFATAGTYLLNVTGGSTNLTTVTPSTPPLVFQNYTWTVFVGGPSVHPGVLGAVSHVSPHPGLYINYELAPGGGGSEDPAIDYETVGYEPILNVYETLIAYNGSKTGPTPDNFVPVLATCVPGSPRCQALYGGQTLANSGNYTFVINGAAQFYDPSTGAHWGVYPSDVVFAFARTLGFSTLPSVAANPGWIQTQALLGRGNATWDPIHATYNNTPLNILNSMTVNDSLCQSLPGAMTAEHGCVTFHATGGNVQWPYFLELVADNLGGSVVPCGWFSASAQAAGVPYWTQGNVSGAGDHPCGMPGSPGFGVAPGAIPATGWDEWEQLGSGSTGRYLGHVQFSMVGSGPYYLSQYTVTQAYQLTANPFYAANPYCTWTGCYPQPKSYIGKVQVTWEPTATEGEQAYASGIADHASIPPSDASLLLQLVSLGKLSAVSGPTLTIGFFPFDLNFNLGAAQRFTTAPISVPSDWFSYLGMRQFFVHAFPYATIQSTIHTRDGIQYAFNYGGAIPQFMANYYPTDIVWPGGDPCTTGSSAGCATYWWNQIQSPTSAYYDPEVSRCSSGSPCQLPLFGETGSADLDLEMSLWAESVSKLSNGSIHVSPVDINFVDLIISTQFAGPGQSSAPFFALGWAPDYPDPTDYTVPLYSANSTYTWGDSVEESLVVPSFTSGCAHGPTDFNYYANLTTPVPQSCQGIAYRAMLAALNQAAVLTAGAYRAHLYDLAEKIANQLALYVYSSQSNEVASVASWVDPGSVNTNVTIGGGGDTPYFWLTGNFL